MPKIVQKVLSNIHFIHKYFKIFVLILNLCKVIYRESMGNYNISRNSEKFQTFDKVVIKNCYVKLQNWCFKGKKY